MEAITEPHVDIENSQEEEVEEQKVQVKDGRGRSPASLANLKPRSKKGPDEPKVKYSTIKKTQDTNIYDFATPPEEPKAKKVASTKPKKRRTRVVVVEDSSDDESDDEIQVVVAKKPKKKTSRPATPKRPVAEPVESDDDELERKPPKPILKAPPKPMINFF